MKKALATIMGLAFAVSAMAQYLIYNVSFKRIDAQFTKVTYQFGVYDGKKKDFTGYFDSFKTASDKLTGYVIIPACKDCNGAWEEFGSATYTVADADASSAFVPEEKNTDGYVVVTRNGDNLAKNPYLAEAGYADFTGKVVWILRAHVDAAMFGKGAAVRLAAKEEADDCSDAIAELADYEGTVTSVKAAISISSTGIHNSRRFIIILFCQQVVEGGTITAVAQFRMENVNQVGQQQVGMHGRQLAEG